MILIKPQKPKLMPFWHCFRSAILTSLFAIHNSFLFSAAYLARARPGNSSGWSANHIAITFAEALKWSSVGGVWIWFEKWIILLNEIHNLVPIATISWNIVCAPNPCRVRFSRSRSMTDAGKSGSVKLYIIISSHAPLPPEHCPHRRAYWYWLGCRGANGGHLAHLINLPQTMRTAGPWGRVTVCVCVWL